MGWRSGDGKGYGDRGKGWGESRGESAVGKPTAAKGQGGLLRQWHESNWGNYKGAPQRDDLLFYH